MSGEFDLFVEMAAADCHCTVDLRLDFTPFFDCVCFGLFLWFDFGCYHLNIFRIHR
jgi:hypothetical protein